MRRIVMLVVVALVMAAMMLAMLAPVIASERVCATGFHPQPIFNDPTNPGLDAFQCVPAGQPPPND
jgi:hypothetical protein